MRKKSRVERGPEGYGLIGEGPSRDAGADAYTEAESRSRSRSKSKSRNLGYPFQVMGSRLTRGSEQRYAGSRDPR